jgi:phosphoribosylformimino-5-aminoimidazole carboxamide ribonucleotide (ProFAR) isomerase
VEWVGKAAQGGSVIVSGGIGTLQDLKELAELALDALDGVIVGTALYERRFTVAEAKQALTLP